HEDEQRPHARFQPCPRRPPLPAPSHPCSLLLTSGNSRRLTGADLRRRYRIPGRTDSEQGSAGFGRSRTFYLVPADTLSSITFGYVLFSFCIYSSMCAGDTDSDVAKAGGNGSTAAPSRAGAPMICYFPWLIRHDGSPVTVAVPSSRPGRWPSTGPAGNRPPQRRPPLSAAPRSSWLRIRTRPGSRGLR